MPIHLHLQYQNSQGGWVSPPNTTTCCIHKPKVINQPVITGCFKLELVHGLPTQPVTLIQTPKDVCVGHTFYRNSKAALQKNSGREQSKFSGDSRFDCVVYIVDRFVVYVSSAFQADLISRFRDRYFDKVARGMQIFYWNISFEIVAGFLFSIGI